MERLLRVRAELLARADTLVKSSGDAEQIESVLSEIQSVDLEIADAKKSADFINRLAGVSRWEDPEDSDFGVKADANASWAQKAATKVQAIAHQQSGSKAMLPNGSVLVDSAISTTAPLPEKPRRLLDFIAKEALDGPSFSFLQQQTFVNAAAVVAPLATKPMSTSTWLEKEGRAVVIATMSEELPTSYFADYANLMQILDQQLRAGVLDSTEALLYSGNGAGEPKGIANTSGVRSIAFQTTVLNTLRKARLALELDGVPTTGWVFNPSDLADLELLREGTGATAGGFLLDSPGFDRILGGGIPVISSPRVPAGKVLTGDFSVVTLMVREALSSVVFLQNRDLAERNAAQVRTEHRVGIRITRPSALALVNLA